MRVGWVTPNRLDLHGFLDRTWILVTSESRRRNGGFCGIECHHLLVDTPDAASLGELRVLADLDDIASDHQGGLQKSAPCSTTFVSVLGEFRLNILIPQQHPGGLRARHS